MGLRKSVWRHVILSTALCVIVLESFALSYDVDLDFFRRASNVSRYYREIFLQIGEHPVGKCRVIRTQSPA